MTTEYQRYLVTEEEKAFKEEQHYRGLANKAYDKQKLLERSRRPEDRGPEAQAEINRLMDEYFHYTRLEYEAFQRWSRLRNKLDKERGVLADDTQSVFPAVGHPGG